VTRPRAPRSWLPIAALIALTVVVYSPVWTFGFVSVDDAQYVSGNPHVTQGLSVDGLRWALTTRHAANWHPVTWLSHMLDVELFGVSPGAHHAVNLTLHVVNVLLVFWLMSTVTGRMGRSWWVAAIFAVHPLHVESVAWISERKDVLSTCFALLAVQQYVSFARGGGG
jgi:hypothetical protein